MTRSEKEREVKTLHVTHADEHIDDNGSCLCIWCGRACLPMTMEEYEGHLLNGMQMP